MSSTRHDCHFPRRSIGIINNLKISSFQLFILLCKQVKSTNQIYSFISINVWHFKSKSSQHNRDFIWYRVLNFWGFWNWQSREGVKNKQILQLKLATKPFTSEATAVTACSRFQSVKYGGRVIGPTVLRGHPHAFVSKRTFCTVLVDRPHGSCKRSFLKPGLRVDIGYWAY